MTEKMSLGTKRILREIAINQDPFFIADLVYRIAMMIAADTNATEGHIGGDSEKGDGSVKLEWQFDSDKLAEGVELFQRFKEALGASKGKTLLEWKQGPESTMNVRIDEEPDGNLGIHTDVEDILFSRNEVAQLRDVLNQYLVGN